MSMGKFNLGPGGLKGYFSNTPRLILIGLMVIAAILGSQINKFTDRADNALERSVGKALKTSFAASLEGTTTIQDSLISTHRLRQLCDHDGNLKTNGGTADTPYLRFNVRSALEALRNPTIVVEHDMEDMYGHGTRLFSGSFSLPDDDENTMHAFKYWADMRSLYPVRLTITTVERNIMYDDDGDGISRITYLNIRYYSW